MSEAPSGPAHGEPRPLLRTPAYLVALVVAVVVALGFGLVIPVLPLFARSFGVGLFAVTVVVSAFAGVRLVSNLYTGGLSDRIGTRRAVFWGATIVAVSSALTATAGSYWALLGYRAAGGFGSALFFNALLSHVILLAPPHERGRAVGGLQGAFLFGIAFGPTVGGLLAEPLGLRWPFAIYALFCLTAGLVARGFLPRHAAPTPAEGADVARASPAVEPRPHGLRALLRVARDLCRDPTFVVALVLMGASRWSSAGVRFSLIPVFGVEVAGASQLLVSVALTVAAVSHLSVTWAAGAVADRVGRRTLTIPAFAGFGLVAILLGLADTVPLFLVGMALYGFGSGFTAVTPAAIVGDVVPPHRTGASVGVLNTAGDLGSVLGPLISGGLAEAFGYVAGFGASGLLLLGGALLALRMRETLPARAAGA